MSKKTDYGVIKASFENEGWQLLTIEYINNKQKLDCLCPNGHEHSISWSHWKRGNRCPYCSHKIKKTIDEINDLFVKESCKLMTKEYKNCDSKLEYICPNGHRSTTTWRMWRKGYRCPLCNGHNRYNDDVIKEILSLDKYTLCSNYKAYHTPIKVMCPNGHIYEVSLANWLSKGYRCQKCNLSGRRESAQELELKHFLSECGIEIESCDRHLIKPYELDIIVPDKKIAIEYCGLYWHSELQGKTNQYHLMKLDACKNIGYSLITVFEDEFVYKKDIVLNRLLQALWQQNTTKKLLVEECIISEVDDSVYYAFCNRYSIKQFARSTVRLGVFYMNNLVAVMSFSESDDLLHIWNLEDFCIDFDFVIPRIRLNLLTHFENNFEWKEIIYYEDRRWPTNINYNELGFKNVETIEPSCWRIKKDERIHKITKESLVSENQDLNRIWDCGYLKHTKTKGDF